MSPGLLALAALVGSGIAAAVALYVTAVKCQCGSRTPDLADHYRVQHPTEECPR